MVVLIDGGINYNLDDNNSLRSLLLIFNCFGVYQEARNEGFTATYQNYFETQLFRFCFKYKF
jgi:hypothetical protein